MADTKITALTALTGADPANDVIPIVDVSDTTMAASGTTKKISVNNILGASGTATLASATITGDLTVDTSTLKVDSANNRVGIGTASPGFALDILGASGLGIRIYESSTGNNNRLQITQSGTDSTFNSTYSAGSGAFAWQVASSELMRLNSTGLGVGVSPAFKLSAAGVSQFYAEADGIYASGNSSPDLYTIGVNYYNAAGTEGVKVSARPSWKIEHKNSSDALAYLDIGYRAASAAASAFTSRFKIDGSGNVGIGVTPSAWGAGNKAIQVSTGAAFWGDAANAYINSNSFYNGTNFIYLTNAAANRYAAGGGVHYWYTAPSGTAGNAITFTQAMTLDASGNLLVGTTTTSGNAGGLKLSNVSGNRGEITFSNNSGSADYVARFNYGSTPTLVGNITVSSGGTSFVTTSDYRLKESVVPLSGGLARVSALKPSTYKWKADGSNGEGFIAHELAEVVPLAVTGEKDAVNADGSIKPQGVDLSKVVPVLVAAIQELTARVQTLETR